jgi:cytochrome c553
MKQKIIKLLIISSLFNLNLNAIDNNFKYIKEVNLTKEDINQFDGFLEYRQCAYCHGMIGEQSALGKSERLNMMTEKEIANAMFGYKYGNYGKGMKKLMKNQVKNLSDKKIVMLANYIYHLNY